jgi:hypothetical protein
MYRTLFIPFLLVLAGCAATGPTSSPLYPALVAAALPPEAGPSIRSDQGSWYPNVIGFADIRTTMGYGAVPPVSGVLVITPTALVFEQWDDRFHRFEVMKLLKISDIKEATIDTFGLGARLVLKSADYSFNSFAFSKAAGQLGDSDKAREIAGYLSGRIEGPPSQR